MLEKKIFDEPQVIMNGIIKDLDKMKTKMANELAGLRGQLTEDSDMHLLKQQNLMTRQFEIDNAFQFFKSDLASFKLEHKIHGDSIF